MCVIILSSFLITTPAPLIIIGSKRSSPSVLRGVGFNSTVMEMAGFGTGGDGEGAAPLASLRCCVHGRAAALLLHARAAPLPSTLHATALLAPWGEEGLAPT